MARLSSSFTFLFLYFFLENNNYFLLFLSILFGVISILTSIFARQVILFVIPLIGLFSFSVDILLIVPIIFNSTITWGKYFFDGMKNTLITWKLYKTHTKKSLKVLKKSIQ